MVMINIYLQCKQYELALDEIEELLNIETIYTVNNFKLLKEVDPIRDNLRFQELMKSYAL